jgi:hypothetical protein
MAGARGHRVFPGRLEKHLLGIGERAVVTAMRAPVGDFRDWEAVRAWAEEIAEEMTENRGREPAAGAGQLYALTTVTRPDHGDRARRVVDALIAHRAEQQAGEPAVAPGAHDQQVSVPRRSDQARCRRFVRPRGR